MKFKVGNEVKVRDDYYDQDIAALVGGKVVHVGTHVGDDWVTVDFPGWRGGHGGDTGDGRINSMWGFEPSDLVKVKKEKKAKKSQEYKGNGKHDWEDVTDEGTERLRVPGGWLYRDGMDTVFVPMPEVVKHKV